MYETRLCLESLATERAAVRIGEDELDGLDALVRRMESVVSVLHDSGGETLADPGAVSEMVATDIAFHRILVRAGGNRWIWKVLDGLHVFPRFFGTYRDVYSLRNLEQSVASHREIVVALRRGDAVASSVAIREHLERGREIVFAGLPVRPFSAERQWNEALDLSGPYKEFLNEIPELRKLMR
jgi:DNA-binding GntR family transcriptional regulator